MSIGDHFPEALKEEYSRRALSIGSVVRCLVDDTIDGETGLVKPKIKIWVVVGFDHASKQLASVYINTEIIPHILSKPALLGVQYLLRPDERELIDYDCHADCSRLSLKQTEKIQALLKENPEFVKGSLTKSELADVMSLLRATTNIPVRLKKQFKIL
jgi:hypothetical protein